MSTHAIPAGIDIDWLQGQLVKHLRRAETVIGDPPTAIEFMENLTPAEVVTLSAILNAWVVREGSVSSAQAIPGWASWSEEHALDWYNTNVETPFASATTAAQLKAVLGNVITAQQALIRMVLALRNAQRPELEE